MPLQGQFDVTIRQNLVPSTLAWPSQASLAGDFLGGNDLYEDLRRFTWADADATLLDEQRAIQQVLEEGARPAALSAGRWGLDLGVASSVVALSAAGCVPFTSCNASTFEPGHSAPFPIVRFYARPAMADILV